MYFVISVFPISMTSGGLLPAVASNFPRCVGQLWYWTSTSQPGFWFLNCAFAAATTSGQPGLRVHLKPNREGVGGAAARRSCGSDGRNRECGHERGCSKVTYVHAHLPWHPGVPCPEFALAVIRETAQVVYTNLPSTWRLPAFCCACQALLERLLCVQRPTGREKLRSKVFALEARFGTNHAQRLSSTHDRRTARRAMAPCADDVPGGTERAVTSRYRSPR